MSHKHHRHHFFKGLGYATLSVASGVSTVFLATTTVGLAVSIAGIPLAILTGMGTVACASGTVIFASAAMEHFHEDWKDHDHTQSHHIIEISSNTNHLDEINVKTEKDIKRAYKPFFTPAPSKSTSDVTEINNEPHGVRFG